MHRDIMAAQTTDDRMSLHLFSNQSTTTRSDLSVTQFSVSFDTFALKPYIVAGETTRCRDFYGAILIRHI